MVRDSGLTVAPKRASFSIDTRRRAGKGPKMPDKFISCSGLAQETRNEDHKKN